MSFQGRPTVGAIKQMLHHIDAHNQKVTRPENKIITSVELEKQRPELGSIIKTLFCLLHQISSNCPNSHKGVSIIYARGVVEIFYGDIDL